MGTTRSANGPTHGEVIFPFACFPCLMIAVPFVVSHYSSKYSYKNSLSLINLWLKKLKPVNIPIFLSRSTGTKQALRVDRKRLYTYKRGHLGSFRSYSLKIDTSVDVDIECQPQYQIRKGFIKRLKNEKAK